MLHTSVMAKVPQESFWDRLEEASRDLGLPYGLSDIGRELDIWPSAVQKWRDGEGLPGQKNLIALATNRGVNTEWLKTGRGPKLSEAAMDAATRELLAIWTKLEKDAQERLLSAAKYEKSVSQATGQISPDNPPHPSARPPRR